MVARSAYITPSMPPTQPTLRQNWSGAFSISKWTNYTIERIVEATTLQARMLKLPPRCVMLLA